ncbi:MAG: ribose 5-phosphate isomerase B [Acidimicrobiaceae bacterium]|nr:ribose 5-phosphate isomerase B [Acidimicrobiaceae bacterium]
MIVAIGCDHAGFDVKEKIKKYLIHELLFEVIDVGTSSIDSVDYPNFGHKVGKQVSDGTADKGIVVCGSGIGIGMAANKISGVRAATVHNVETATLARQHNDANIVCFGERLIEVETARESLIAFLNAEFEGGRHTQRVQKLNDL